MNARKPAPKPKRKPVKKGAPAGSLLSSMRKAAKPIPASAVSVIPHLIIEARAGSGKTTTLVEGLNQIKGIKPRITPSPQQAAIWQQMSLSADANSICFVAFNKSIAMELQQRVPKGCDAMTMHSMGFKAVTKAFGYHKPAGWAVQELIALELKRNLDDLKRNRPTLLSATNELVSLCKQNLSHIREDGSELSVDDPDWVEVLNDLAGHYGVEVNGDRAEVFQLVPRVLERCKYPQPGREIAFDDQVWLPVVLKLPVTRYDLLLVDEAQDLNRCQQALAKVAGVRLILCGDPKQAIYGFAGADAESMSRMTKELSATPSGCQTLPLTVTRRCAKAIVEEANQIVPDFFAHEDNGPGKVSSAIFKGQSYGAGVADGDFVLCRVNAPLVSECFKFIKAGRKANIQGRDVGRGLISTVEKMKATSIVHLVEKLSIWLEKETAKEYAKSHPVEDRVIALQDRFDCLVCFAEGIEEEGKEGIEAVIKKIESVFTDDKVSPGIKLSSVHKSKGLEAKRVFILMPQGASIPHPMAKTAWQKEQEMNLKYVAITRAIEELVWVA